MMRAASGVALTGANLVANARQIMAHGADFLGPADVWVNPLPMFHSFGLTAGTLLPTAETTGVVAPGAPQPEVEFHRPSETVEPDRPETEAEEAKRVLARLKEMSGGKREDDDEDMRR